MKPFIKYSVFRNQFFYLNEIRIKKLEIAWNFWLRFIICRREISFDFMPNICHIFCAKPTFSYHLFLTCLGCTALPRSGPEHVFYFKRLFDQIHNKLPFFWCEIIPFYVKLIYKLSLSKFFGFYIFIKSILLCLYAFWLMFYF